MRDLVKGKRIVVTGSASGIGWETARLLSEQGAEVLGVDVEKCFDHVEEFYRADLSDPATIDALLDVLPEEIDGLVNSAGLTTGDASLLLQLNLIGLKRLTCGLVPKLETGASIVNVASVAGTDWPDALDAIKAAEHLDYDNLDDFIARWNLSPERRAYEFSKQALTAWTMQNHATWQDRGIQMNCVSPAPAETGAKPKHVAGAIAFLLSDLSAAMRGTNIPADGGQSSNILCSRHGL